MITLIMLSIITFMAITFLVLSQRERTSANTSIDQKTAHMAVDTAFNRSVGELIARMLVFTNFQDMPFMVSTSYVNYLGFNNGLTTLNGTNVNYDYELGGGPYTGGAVELQRNIENLLFNPRVPVYVITNIGTGAGEFRFYLDLNRNGRFDPNGNFPVLSGVPGLPYINATNGQPAAAGLVPLLTNDFVGDPEWIGILERPQWFHSPDNRAVARYAYAVIPIANTLDINYIHDRAKGPIIPTVNGEGFLRNQGGSTFELNLAGFLADLNTNVWWTNNGFSQYNYTNNPLYASSGMAFSNANDLLQYRYGNTPNGYFTLSPAISNFANPANLVNAGIDLYSQGNLQNQLMLGTSNNATPEIMTVPWAGSDNTQHVFTIQDFFDPSKAGPTFPTLLQNLGTSNDSYDADTYYRMISQLGSDSSPERNKMNINWKNTDNSGRVVVGMETNLIPWTPIDFFTNAAARMFQQANMRDRSNNLITIGNIPFYWDPAKYGTTNASLYTPAVHRILQLAANMYDATSSRFLGGGGPTNYPSVFRPVFRSSNGVAYVIGYEEVSNSAPVFLPFLEATNFVKQDQSSNDIVNIYGVPWVVGVKKGFPNFNEMSMNNPLWVQRTLSFTNTSGLPTPPWATNQMIQFAISNQFGFEAWNSYTNGYFRPLRLIASNELSIVVSNEFGVNFVNVQNLPFGTDTNLAGWPGWNNKPNLPDTSFQVPLRVATNFVNGIYLNQAPWVVPLAPPQFGPTVVPHFWMSLNFKIQFCLIDTSVKPNRVVDFVNVVDNEPTIYVNDALSGGVSNLRDQTREGDIWETNLLNGVSLGILNQIDVGEDIPNGYKDWIDPNRNPAAESLFRARLAGQAGTATNSFADPYIAQGVVWQLISWQANDPLVHYTARDMTATNSQGAIFNTVATEYISDPVPKGAYLPNLGKLNLSYQPWGGYPLNHNQNFDYNYQVKDPLINQSDNWDFMTNKMPNIGWLGRVHRGTPWQTVYMKSSTLKTNDWLTWCNDGIIITNSVNGNQVTVTPDWWASYPINDYSLFDLFTVGVNDNATRGQLNVNQNGLAAWSAALSGVNVLSNTPTGPVPVVISPAGVYDLSNNSPTPVAQMVLGTNGINSTRANLIVTNGPVFPNQVFQHAGDVLATPALTVASPFLNTSALSTPTAGGINDEILERIPQQIMSLLTLNPTPRFVIYSYGQTLHPADHSLVIGGTFNGLCTNYQVTAEIATRAVVRVDGSPDPKYTPTNPDPYGRYYPPHVVVEQFNILPPD